MTDKQFYGGSQEEAKNGLACQVAREKAIANGFTVRREKRGKETVLVITPAQPNNRMNLTASRMGAQESQVS